MRFKKEKGKEQNLEEISQVERGDRDGLSCENETRLENLNRNYVNKRNVFAMMQTGQQ